MARALALGLAETDLCDLTIRVILGILIMPPEIQRLHDTRAAFSYIQGRILIILYQMCLRIRNHPSKKQAIVVI